MDCIQWKFSNQDILGTEESVLISEVSLISGVVMYTNWTAKCVLFIKMFLFWGVLNKGFQPVLKTTAIGYVVNMYSTLLGMRVRFIPFTSPPLSTLPITMVPMSCVVGHDSCIHYVQCTRCTIGTMCMYIHVYTIQAKQGRWKHWRQSANFEENVELP